MKDYYKIMNLPPDASAEEIRQAYRRFAKKYHPDKNAGQAATSVFLDIQEAYHTLSDEKRRQVFHAKTQYPFPGKKAAAPLITSEIILQKCRLLNENIKGMNKYRINLSLISQTIDAILSEKNMAVIHAEKKSFLTREITSQLILAMAVLPYRLVVANTSKLLRLTGSDLALQQQVMAFGNHKRKMRFWEQYNFIIILVTTLLLCGLIILLSE